MSHHHTYYVTSSYLGLKSHVSGCGAEGLLSPCMLCHVYVCVYVYVYVYVCVCVYACMHAYMHNCVCVCVCVLFRSAEARYGRSAS